MSTILMTGSDGFVGTQLSRFLVDRGHVAWALDLPVQAAATAYARRFTWDALESIPWSEVDVVIHLAGKAHDTRNISRSQDYFDINVGLTQKVMAALTREPEDRQRKFILFSSVKACADTVEQVLTEEVVPDPKTPYGQSKREAEASVLNSVERSGLSGIKTYLLRPCMIHGPGNKGNLNLLYQIVRKGIPWPLGAFENRRSFASIDNVCAVVSGLVEQDVDSGIYQIADDQPLSTNQLIGIMAESMGRRIRVLKIPQIWIRRLARMGDLFHLPLNGERLRKLTESYVVSNRKIKQALGWDRMPTTAEEGMRRTFRSFAVK